MNTEDPFSLSRLSIRTRLLLLAVCSVGVALTVTCLALALYNYHSLRKSTVEQLKSQAQMLAFNSSGVLTFQDTESAEELLTSLRMFPSVKCEFLVDQSEQVLAAYPANGGFDYRIFAGSSDHEFTDDRHLVIRQPVVENDERVGRLVLLANLDNFYLSLRDYILIVACVMLVSLAIAAFLSLRLQRAISSPIAKLVSAAQRVTEQKDYSARVLWQSEDELGQLCSTFDRMLEEIQSSKNALQMAHDNLEVRVDERTAQLTAEIQERQRVLVELKSAKEAAETANRAKSEFLANMSHEIRTPLNGVLGFADLLSKQIERTDTDACQESLSTIQSSGKHLLALINDILDISKIEAGQLEVEQVSYSPHELITQVTSVLRAQAQKKGLELQYRWASQVPEAIQTDPARLRQLLMNLVGNAVKFTEQGFVCITARLDESKEELSISVEDTGVGISSEKQDSIFDPFVQADNSVTRRFGGTGLGLAISRRLARALGGDLEVTSTKGVGSCFVARIPTGSLDDVVLRPSVAADAIAPRNERPTKADGDAPVHLSRARVLVVDDSPPNRKLIRTILEEADADVVLADNGQVGYEVGRQGDFDVILMDMQMPVMDGYTATRKLRDAGVTLPIVALTAHAMTGDREKCMEAGCSGYLTKPIDVEELIYYLASKLDTHDTASHSPEPVSPALDKTNSDADATNPVLRSTLPTAKPIYAEIVAEFAEYVVQMLDEIESHLTNGDFDQVAMHAHSLKGSGGSAGFPAFTLPAKQLELQAKSNEETRCLELINELRELSDRIEIPQVLNQPATIEGAVSHDSGN